MAILSERHRVVLQSKIGKRIRYQPPQKSEQMMQEPQLPSIAIAVITENWIRVTGRAQSGTLPPNG
jgi:hypothetical protein